MGAAAMPPAAAHSLAPNAGVHAHTPPAPQHCAFSQRRHLIAPSARGRKYLFRVFLVCRISDLATAETAE